MPPESPAEDGKTKVTNPESKKMKPANNKYEIVFISHGVRAPSPLFLTCKGPDTLAIAIAIRM